MKFINSIIIILITVTLSFGLINDTIITNDSILIVDYYKSGNPKLESYYKIAITNTSDTVYLATGKQTKYFKSGIIQATLYFRNGKPNGECQIFYKDGSIEKEFNYIDGLVNGPYKFYYKNGNLKREGTFRNDLDFGVCKKYHENGNIAIIEIYNDDGIQNGIVKFYNKDGILEKEVSMYDGKTKN